MSVSFCVIYPETTFIHSQSRPSQHPYVGPIWDKGGWHNGSRVELSAGSTVAPPTFARMDSEWGLRGF